MGRIRTVKPELFKHSGLYDAEQHYKLPLRISFVGLFCCCDRQGRFKWRPRELKLDIIPYDDINFELVLNALSDSGFIIKYVIDGIAYGYIPSWSRHQVINNRESQSMLPDPTATILLIGLQARVPDASITCPQRVLDAYPTSLNPAAGEGNRREGNGTIYICDSDNEFSGQDNANLDSGLVVFTYYQTTMKHPKAIFDSRRKNKIKNALKLGFTVEQLKLAIDGCAKSAWHMGNNDKNQKYDGISTIFRDAEQIEKFIILSGNTNTIDGINKIVSQIDQMAAGAINV